MSSPPPALPGAGELAEPVQPPGTTAAPGFAAAAAVGGARAPATSGSAEPAGAPILPPVPCPSCTHPLTGTFCAGCGERRPTAADLSLRRFAGEALAVATSADSVLVRTAATLLRRPGELTRAYVEGRRSPYLPPLRVFLLANLLYFLVALPLRDRMFTTPLTVYVRYWPFDVLVADLIHARVAERGMAFEEYARVFDTSLESHASALVITMVPLLALLLHLLYVRSRRYYVEHLVFSLHFYAFFLLVWPASVIVLRAAMVTAVGLGLPGGSPARVLGQLSPAFLALAYLYPAIRRVYGQGRARSAANAVLVTFAWAILVLSAYRLILFFVAFTSV